MNKKVCIFTSVHPPFDTRLFYKQAKSLVKAGYGVTFIVQHDKDEVVDGVKIVALPKPRNRLWRMLGTWRVFRLVLKQKADVYHFHDPELLFWGWLLQKLTHKPVIYDVHEDYPKQILSKEWLPSITRKPISYVFNFLEKWVALRLDYIIVAGDNLTGKFKKGEVAVIRNYPILENIQPKSKYDFKSPALVYAGGLTGERGISEIVQAMEYVDPSRSIKLMLYGKFQPESYEERLRSLRGFDKVDYVGWIRPEELWQKMIQATAGIVCLRPVERYSEAMPTKLFEYMAAGLPVIASNFPLWKEIVEGNNCGLTVNPLNPREIAKAIAYLIEHPNEARKMGENGRKAVVVKYNWETESKKLIAVYENLLEGR